MVCLLVLQGLSVMISCVSSYRWGDIKSMRIMCMVSLIAELVMAGFTHSAVSTADIRLSIEVCENLYRGLGFKLPVIFCFDPSSASFIAILVSALLLCFSLLREYFEYDVNGAHITLLSALFSQLALVYFLTGDLASMAFFWELISAVSFFLVRFWSARVTSMKAGMKVYTVSQFGDLFFLYGAFVAVNLAGTSDVFEINLKAPGLITKCTIVGPMLVQTISIIAGSILSALFLKSAQFIFYPWLLDAMEAPVPISAQLHSSTLVVIGFYATFRLWTTISLSFLTEPSTLIFGSVTAMGASVLGLRQIDGKRLLACSTASQLGYVVIGLGLDLPDEALSMLLFCCCNKAYTFVWFGSVMERAAGFSDFRVLRAITMFYHERFGLLTALANSSIFPGSFAWNVKALMASGDIYSSNYMVSLSIEVLSLTWFLTSIYLARLALAIWATPSQGFIEWLVILLLQPQVAPYVGVRAMRQCTLVVLALGTVVAFVSSLDYLEGVIMERPNAHAERSNKYFYGF